MNEMVAGSLHARCDKLVLWTENMDTRLTTWQLLSDDDRRNGSITPSLTLTGCPWKDRRTKPHTTQKQNHPHNGTYKKHNWVSLTSKSGRVTQR